MPSRCRPASAAVERAVETRDAALLIADPLMAYLGMDTNSNRDQDVRRALAPTAAMLERTGLRWVAHPALEQGASRGTLSTAAAADRHHRCGTHGAAGREDPENESASILAPQKCNLGPRRRRCGSVSPGAPRPTRPMWRGTSSP